MTGPLRLSVLAALATACATGTPHGNGTPEQAIRARGEAMMATENARDLAAVLAFYAPDAVIQAPGMPPVVGRDAIRALYERQNAAGAPAATGAFAERVISVAASGDLAWEHGTARTTLTTPEGERVLSSKQLMIWRKVDGTWLLAGLSYSGNAPLR